MPPLISVVIPVYDVAGYLDGCLEAILSQDDGCLEVIAVDDASPGESGAILDARAARDQRLRVLHMARNVGPGGARNAGLSRAAGEYVWFVDADDLVADGALAAIAGRLTAVRPDVLLVDYESLHPDGTRAPSPGRAEFRGSGGRVLTLTDRPELIHLTMTSWSKVIRRAFLVGLGLSFPPGIHEDVLMSTTLLLAARRIALLDRVCYRYRRDRPGSFMATPGSDHLAIFRSYEQVFALVEDTLSGADPAVAGPVRAAVFERAIWHYASLLEAGRGGRGGFGLLPSGGLIPPAERRRFFDRMHADFLRYRPQGYRHPAGARGAKLRLIERGAYRTYCLLEPVNRIRLRARAAAGRPLASGRPGG
jgi:CDP-glycerol glycerophosphotransferase